MENLVFDKQNGGSRFGNTSTFAWIMYHGLIAEATTDGIATPAVEFLCTSDALLIQ